MPEGSPGTGFDIRRLFSPGTQAREGREDPRTEPHAPVHAAPENPTPITLEDMSDQGGVGSVSKAEATLTHPSARDIFPSLLSLSPLSLPPFPPSFPSLLSPSLPSLLFLLSLLSLLLSPRFSFDPLLPSFLLSPFFLLSPPRNTPCLNAHCTITADDCAVATHTSRVTQLAE